MVVTVVIALVVNVIIVIVTIILDLYHAFNRHPVW